MKKPTELKIIWAAERLMILAEKSTLTPSEKEIIRRVIEMLYE